MDGWITIGSKLDNKELERNLRIAQGDLKRFEKEAEKLLKQKSKIEVDLQQVESAKIVLREMTDEELKNAQTQEKVDAILKDESFQIKLLNEGYKATNKELEEINQKIDNNAGKQEIAKQNIEEIAQKIRRVNEASNFKGNIDRIGTSIQDVTRKVIRWGLAVFGVRSAYNFVRQAMSTLSQYDEQLATNIEYIRFALASMLKPVIEEIIQLAYTLLTYINYLSQAWFGVNLFANATTKAFQKQNKVMGGTVKEAKELQKTLAGFDEMNILQQNGDVSSGGGGGGVSIPSFDLSEMQKVKIPKWLEWIKDHGNEIKNIIIGIGIALAAIKFAQLLTWAGELTGLLGGLLQIGIIAIGVELLYTALTGRELISDIMEIKKGFEDLNEIRKEQKNQAEITQESVRNLIKSYNDLTITTGVTKEETQQYINTLLNGIETNNKLIESEEKQKSWLGALNGDNKKLTETQKEHNKTIEIQINELKKLYEKGELNKEQTQKYIDLLKKQIDKTVESSGKLAVNSKEYENNRKKVNELKGELERITGKKYDITTEFMKPDTTPIQRALNDLVNGFKLSLEFGFGGSSRGGGGFRAKGGIYYPKLATGGIINMPGRGVPYHGATIGERGPEAVVPLTDSQQMALLGEAIGKYITINANITNTMNGRIISREIQRIQNQSDFAMNR